MKRGANSAILEHEEQRRMDRMRQEAASAFHWLDAHERIRVALHSRSRPPHLRADAIAPGTTVYFFKQPGQNRRTQDFATAYQGPAIVACAEGPNKLWVRYKRSVVKVALGDVRLATSEEEVSAKYIMEAMQVLEQELTGERRAPGYEDEEMETRGNLASGTRSAPILGEAHPRKVENNEGMAAGPQDGGQSVIPPAKPMFPEPTPEVVDLAQRSEDLCRRLDGLPPKHRSSPYDRSHMASVPKKIAFFEKGGKDDTWHSILQDADTKLASGSGLQRLGAEAQVRQVHNVTKVARRS